MGYSEFYQKQIIDITEMVKDMIADDNLSLEEKTILRSLHRNIREASRQPVRVVLCAMFQSGKSTTTNTLLDGHEISLSSIDSGLRTSTGRIELSPSNRENVNVQWLSLEEIASQISSLSGIKFNQGDLVLETYRNAAFRRLARRWNEVLDAEDNDVLIRLIQAAILLTYCKASSFEAYKRVDRSAYETTRMMTAMADETQRWISFIREGSLSADSLKERIERIFPLENVSFMLVRSVHVDVKSSLLRDLDVQIIDIPGFGVSERDNQLAWNAVSDAQVIVYIFNGEKEPGELERSYVRRLGKYIDCTRFVFAVNCKERAKEAIVSSIRELISSVGFNDAPLITYNARLANCVSQGHLILENRLDKSTEDVILARAKRMDLEICDAATAWKEIVSDSLRSTDRRLARQIEDSDISQEMLVQISQYSGYEVLLGAIRNASYADAPEKRVSAFQLGRMLRYVDDTQKKIDKRFQTVSIEEKQQVRTRTIGLQQREINRINNALCDSSELRRLLRQYYFEVRILTSLSALPYQEKAIHIALEKSLSGIQHPPIESMLMHIDFLRLRRNRGFMLLSQEAFISDTINFYEHQVIPFIREECLKYVSQNRMQADEDAFPRTKCLRETLNKLRGIKRKLQLLKSL